MPIEEKIVEQEIEETIVETEIQPEEMPKTMDENKAENGNYKAEIAEIARLCKLAKMPEKLAEFIESGMSIDDVRDSLMKALANKTEDIRSTVSLNTKQDESPVVMAAKARQQSISL